MVVIRRLAATLVLIAGCTLAMPADAQTTAILKVTARVVAECTVSSERDEAGRNRRCSEGVASKVDRRVVKIGELRSRAYSAGVRRHVSRKRVLRSTVDGHADVMLVTVTY